MARRRSFGKYLDEWFPRLVRYIGLVLLLYTIAIDRAKNPALLPAAVALIFFKNVLGSGNGGQ